MRYRFTNVLVVLAAAALASCGGDESDRPRTGAARSTLIMAPGWVAGSGWPQETVVALSSVHVQLNAVVDGDVAVVTAHGGPYLALGEEAVIGLGADVNGHVTADSLRVQLGASVQGGASFNELVGIGRLEGGTSTPIAMPLAITVPTVPDFAAGTTAVEVPARQTQTLNPGGYGAVHLQAGTASSKTVLTLSGGVYRFASLDLDAYSRVQCAAPCEIRIKGRLAAGLRTYIGPAGVSGLPVSAAQVIVEGGNGGSGSLNATPFAVDVGSNAELKAHVFVPNGTLALRSGSSSVGKFVARAVDIGPGAYVQDGTGVAVLPDSWMTGPRWPDQVLTALNSVDINANGRVTGDVSVILAADGPTLQLGNEATLGLGARLSGNLAADTVSVGLLAQVTGSVSHNGLVNLGIISGGTVTPLEVPLPITVPAFPAFAAGTTTVDVPARADQPLAAGAYGLVRLRAGTGSDNTVLRLTGGIYAIADLDMAANTRVECAAACEIRIKNRIVPPLLGPTSIGPAAGSGLNTADVRVFVEGRNGGLGGPNATPFAAAVGPNSTVHGLFFVPNGTLNLRAGTNARGRFVAKDLLIGSGTTELGGLMITEHPADLVATEGTSATFTCAAAGSNLQYRWQKNGADISGATAASYTITSAAPADAGEYRCIVSDGTDSATSATATLTISLLPPAITQHPQAQTASEGQSATFTCATTGTLVRYRWQKGGDDIPNATDASYTLASVTPGDAGTYRCIADNTDAGPGLTGGGTTPSDGAMLTVRLNAPVITQQPASATVDQGEDATFTCVASGTLVTYQWQKNGDDIAGATGSTLTIADVDEMAAGTYRCVARNDAAGPGTTGGGSVTSQPATLTVRLAAPVITQNPESVTLDEGAEVTFSCAASGRLVRYQWQKGGADIAGATGETYTITNIAYGHAGDYRCVATNEGAGQDTIGGGTAMSSVATLTVRLAAPVILDHPASATIDERGSATFSCDASGALVRYQWQKGGTDIAGATGQTYTIANVAYGHAGDYRCVATNLNAGQGTTGGGTATSNAATLTVRLAAPVIDQLPADRIATEGTSTTFTCHADGTLVSYRWQKGGVDIPGAIGPSFTIDDVDHEHAGEYRCVAWNNEAGQGTTGGGSVTSEAATLTVRLNAPEITQHPVSLTVDEGEDAVLTCVAEGTLVTYQWQKDGDDIEGATDSTLTIAAVDEHDPGAYRCVARNEAAGPGTTGGGSVTSQAATLTVRLAAPAITQDPESVTVDEHGEVTLSCVASGRLVRYRWQKGGTDIAGATDSTYTIAPVAHTDAGEYRCVATNEGGGQGTTGGGTASSAAATLTVRLAAPAILEHPVSATIDESDPVTFACDASGALVTYQWQKGGIDIAGATGKTYTIANVEYGHAGDYRCVASNLNAGQGTIGGGTATSDAATLTVRLAAPVFEEQPADRIVTEGTSTTFRCEARGTLVRYQWQHGGADIPDATDREFTIDAVGEDDAGDYRCVAWNDDAGQGTTGGGRITSAAATLTVRLNAPVIEQHPVSVTVDEGADATFTCAAEGTAVRYRWQTGGDDIAGATLATLTLEDVDFEDIGDYRCVASNDHGDQGTTGGGSVTSQAATLTLRLRPPAITQDPVSVTADEDADVTFTCAAEGTLVTFQWQKGGADIPGATDETYTVSDVSDDDAGEYRCVATNLNAGQGTTGGGSATSNAATLTVRLAAPVIDQNPVDFTATERTAATFSCHATGSLVHYRWQKDGDDIADATGPELVIDSVTLGHAGAYQCVAWNDGLGQGTTGGGSVTSAPAILTVELIPPVITLQPQSLTVNEGDPFTLTCEAEGTDVSFQWLQGTDEIPAAIDLTYTVDSATILDGGEYYCRAYNSGGEDLSEPAIVTVILDPPEMMEHPTDATVTEGDPVTFTCEARGTLVTYRWQRNQQDIPDADDDTYTIEAVTLTDPGAYRCIATNPSGSVESDEATLDVIPLIPVITQQPQSVTVAEGQTFTLSVAATGGDISYQWQRNGIDIAGATAASYAKQATLSDDGAEFRVVVSNASGSVTSDGATVTLDDDVGPSLTVNQEPQITVTEDSIVISGSTGDNGGGAITTTITSDRFPGQEFGVVLNPDGTFEGELPLGVGENVITITATDAQGNTTTRTIVVTVEGTQVPRVLIAEPDEGAFVESSRVAVRGVVRSSLPPEEIRLQLGDLVTYPAGSGGEYAFEFANVPLIPGPNQLTVVARTAHGDAMDSVVVVRGTPPVPPPSHSPPTIELAVSAPEVFVAADEVVVSGNVNASRCVESVTVEGLPAIVFGEGAAVGFERTLSFTALGVTTIVVDVVATDCDGQTAVASFAAHRDDAAPVIVLHGLQPAPAVNTTVDARHRITGTVTDAALVGFSAAGRSLGVLPTAQPGEWSFAIDVALDRGAQTSVVFEAWDRSGNATTETVILRLDALVDLEILSPAANATFTVADPTVPIEVVVRAPGMAPSDVIVASIDGAAAQELTSAGDYATGTVYAAPTTGEHSLEVVLRNGGGVIIARQELALRFQREDSIPLAVARQEPIPDAQNVEANAPITWHFNRAIDPARLTISVLETAHGQIFDRPDQGADITTQSVINLVRVDREREPVPGEAQNLPGNRMVSFYPSQDYAYGGTVFVELQYDGAPLWRSRFAVRPLPTLVHGFVADQYMVPLEGIEVLLPELGRTLTSDSDGGWSLGFGEPPERRIAPGRYRALFNPDRKNLRFGTVERLIEVGEGLNYASTTRIPELNPAYPFQRIESRQSAPAQLAFGDLQLDLSQVEITSPTGAPEVDVQAQLLQASGLGHPRLERVPVDWAFAIQPAGIELSGALGIRARLPTIDGSHGYVTSLPDHVLLVGLDPESLTIVPIGVARVERAARQIVSTGPVHLRRLEYIGISTTASRGPLVDRYLAGELSIEGLIAALEAE